MEIDKHAIRFIKNSEEATLADLRIVAETYLSNVELLDETSTVPHIQLSRSLKYHDWCLIDALFMGDDSKLYWYITTNYEQPNEDIKPINFNDIPVGLIIDCLKQIDNMLK